MKNLKILFIVFSAVLFFTACEKEESSKLWTISGNVVMQDALTPDITSPLEGINVYLLNAPFTMDSITNWFTKTDILDSTVTDANGLYTFNQIQVGNYTVMPTDISARYRFDWSESPDPISVLSDNTKKEFTMNFTTPEPIVENSGGDFEFEFSGWADNVKGFSTSDGNSGGDRVLKLFRTRRNWGYLGWDWGWDFGPIFGWGGWYWDEVYSTQNILGKPTNIDKVISITKDASFGSREYTNEFHVKIYMYWYQPNTHPFLDYKYTFDLDGLTDENSYTISYYHPTGDWYEITRTN